MPRKRGFLGANWQLKLNTSGFCKAQLPDPIFVLADVEKRTDQNLLPSGYI